MPYEIERRFANSVCPAKPRAILFVIFFPSAMSNRTCLVVDDESVIREYLRLILLRRQFDTFGAEDATQALKIIEKAGGHLDLIIADIRIPGDMSGVDLAHSVRNMYPQIPIVLISGYGDKDASGFDFIPKPFVPEVILHAVDTVLR
jgi:DNA-binding NtrC family response regulator